MTLEESTHGKSRRSRSAGEGKHDLKEFFAGVIEADPLDEKALVTGLLPRDESYPAFGDSQRFCKKFPAQLIGGTFDWR